MVKFTQIVEILPKLQPEQLLELKGRIQSLLSPDEAEYASSDTDFVVDAIQDSLSRFGMLVFPLAGLRRTNQYAQMKPKVMPTLEFLGYGELPRNEVRALLVLSVELLYRDLCAMGMNGVGTRTIMQHLHRIPDVVNKSFPGYAESGLLGMIVKTRI